MQVKVPIGRSALDGELSIPSETWGLVLFAHGSGSSRKSPRNQLVARYLEKAGLGTLLFDLLTGEEERADEATGALRFDIPFLAKRLLAATQWARGCTLVPLCYFGASTGGAAALVAAAAKGPRISAIVSRGGRPDLAGEALSKVKAPTLLIVGGLDTEVLELNRTAFEKLHCVKKLEIVPGASHLFEEKGKLERVAKLSADWFLSHCRED